MYAKNLNWICLVLTAILAGIAPVGLAAQAAGSSASGQPSRWDIFAGYSYLAPRGTVQVPQAGGADPIGYAYNAVNLGGDFSVAYYFNKFVGVQGEYAEHVWGDSSGYPNNIGTHGNDDGFQTFAGGLIARYPMENITPFVHGLFGGAVVEGPFFNQPKLGPDITVGGGMDYETPWLNHHPGDSPLPGGLRIYARRLRRASLSSGWARQHKCRPFERGFCHPRRHDRAAASCDAGMLGQSAIGIPWRTRHGDRDGRRSEPEGPCDLHLVGIGRNRKWRHRNSCDGITGAWPVHRAMRREGRCKPGKEGLKPWESATGSASFTVKDFEPPTISCSVNPTTIKPGDTATITSVGVSPQNRSLTYSYTATAGTVTGSGTTAEYSSAGAPTGAVGITCNVSDDKGHSASAQTDLTIQAPVVVVPKTQALCTMNFATDTKRPMRVDNEAKACLDQVALDLKQQADAKAVVVGEADAAENAKMAKEQAYAAKHKQAKVDMYAAQRAVNAKDYLVTEQGIDGSRISVATGTTDGQTVENYLVPAGATFSTDVSGTTPVDETAVKPQARKPLAERHHAKRAAKAAQ